jgi:hypothetical protein
MRKFFGDYVTSVFSGHKKRDNIVNINGIYYTEDQLNEMDEIIIEGDLDLSHMNLKKLPRWVANCKVGGYFNCSYNKLSSLVGAPKEVGGYFNCSHNKLTSLEGCTRKVGGSFYCRDNKLSSLNGAPEEVYGNFYCYGNYKLASILFPIISKKTLDDLPKKISGEVILYL